MFWIAATVVLGIIGLGALFVALGSKPGARWQPALVSAVCGVIWLVVTLFGSLHNVGQRQVGLVYNFSGTYSHKVSPGTVFLMPWQHLKTENVGVQKETFTFDAGNAAVSKDQQPITATIALNYQVTPDDVVSLFKEVGPSWKTTLLDGRVPQDFKETTAQFTSPEITLNRPLLRTQTLGRLKKELCPQTYAPKSGEDFCIDVLDVFVSNVGYSHSYTAAIEAKQVQVQQALQAQAKVAQAKAEADQTVATARGTAESTLLKARADAGALRVKGQAIRANPEVLRLEGIEKLNPNAQLVICTGTTCPSFLPTSIGSGTGGR